MLAEATTSEISKEKIPESFDENKTIARQGGEIAGNARKDIEAKTGCEQRELCGAAPRENAEKYCRCPCVCQKQDAYSFEEGETRQSVIMKNANMDRLVEADFLRGLHR
jgi:hypothetical protein